MAKVARVQGRSNNRAVPTDETDGRRRSAQVGASSPENRFFNPSPFQPAPAKLAQGLEAGIAPAAQILGIEVVQAIQSIDNAVPLIADKPTIVRVYIDSRSFAAETLLTGEVAWRRGSGGFSYLPAMNRVRLQVGPQAPNVLTQRFDIELSLNFRLPPEAISAGTTELRLQRLLVPGGGDVPFVAPPLLTLAFRPAPPLRVRAVGLRYKSVVTPSATVTPSAIHFAYLRSYLKRAYPVATVEWSQIVVDADLIAPPFNEDSSDLANAQLAALRAREISSGTNSRTHYYGLVDNENGSQGSFMRGSAMYDLALKTFGAVAAGPCGVPNGWTGDSDASFADWYGAHELGHTFQRRHPGFPHGVQSRDPDESAFPYPDGLITTNDNRFVGFDVGDDTLGLPMRALPGATHHDVMTYAERQWLSAYTYEAIYARLVAEQ